ncbi:restriction endonuclease subunit S [Streptomyces sp. NPDC002553]|uniref:restriction endonuclease subunit S n=1 Tax=Streptomyces sp. NPDC002553 TaxID=3154417 RepID=UPI00332EED62
MTTDSGMGPGGSGSEGDVTDAEELPAGWLRATLGELGVEVQPGFASGKHNRDGEGILHLRPMNITRNGVLDTLDARYVVDDSDRRVELGDVLFNNTNSPALVGKTAWVDSAEPLAYSNHMTRLRGPEGLDGKFLAAQLHHMWVTGYFKSILNNHVNQASVSRKALLDTVIVVPPLAEQHRIVAKLEEQLANIETGEISLADARSRIVDFVTSLLAEATKPSVEASNWETKTIGEMATVSSGATPLKGRADYYDGGTVPWITSSLLNAPFVDRAEKFITDRAVKETAVKEYPPGTLLLAMYGEGKTRGKCSELRIHATTNQACAGIQLAAEYLCRKDWVKLVLEARYEENRALASGGVQPNLSLGLVKKIEVPLPPLMRQKELLEQVAQRRADAGEMSDAIESVKMQATELRNALLHAAFTGTLVPQDSDDEPASVFLDRIRAERTAVVKQTRRKRVSRTTSPAAPQTSGRPVPSGTQEALPL